MSKYNNVKYKGFDSKKEFLRFQELQMLELAGEIHDLQRQVPFVIVPTQRDEDGHLLEKMAKYIADFVYITKDGEKVVEDAKGIRTPLYKLKKKLMLEKHGIIIKEV